MTSLRTSTNTVGVNLSTLLPDTDSSPSKPQFVRNLVCDLVDLKSNLILQSPIKARLEFYVALKLKLEKGMRVLDVGCGIGGPARAIARFSQATVSIPIL